MVETQCGTARPLRKVGSAPIMFRRSRSPSRDAAADVPDRVICGLEPQEANEEWGLHPYGWWQFERRHCTYSRYVRTVWSDGKRVYKLIDVAMERDCTGSGKSQREFQSERRAMFTTSDTQIVLSGRSSETPRAVEHSLTLAAWYTWVGYEMPDAHCNNYIMWDLRSVYEWPTKFTDRGMQWILSDHPEIGYVEGDDQQYVIEVWRGVSATS